MEMQKLLFLITTYPILENNPIALKSYSNSMFSFKRCRFDETIAIDGTKSRAHNSKKANFNQKKIDKHVDYTVKPKNT
jgi:hypothetical protein